MLARLNKLTARQKKVLELLAEGLPNKVIAHELGISETTVKAHVGEILRKLKVYNRARAIVMLAQFDMRPDLAPCRATAKANRRAQPRSSFSARVAASTCAAASSSAAAA